jgi:hypothetical protein
LSDVRRGKRYLAEQFGARRGPRRRATAFDYDQVPHRIGGSIDTVEAAELIRRIKAFAPMLVSAGR